MTVCIDYFHKNISNRQLWIIFFKHISIKYLKRLYTRNVQYFEIFFQMQENLDCRPKNYKKVGTVVGVGNKNEDLPEEGQNKRNLHPDWRRKKKNHLTNYFNNSEN